MTRRCLALRVELRSICLAALGSNPRVRILKDWRYRASPTIKPLAPEVGLARRCLALRVRLPTGLAAPRLELEGSNPRIGVIAPRQR